MKNIILETMCGDDFKNTSKKAKAMATAKQPSPTPMRPTPPTTAPTRDSHCDCEGGEVS